MSPIATDTAAPLASGIRALPGPPILACRAWGLRYRGQVGSLMDLTQAVPGYPPHPGLLERLAEAAGSRAAAGYGPLEGEPALRQALARDLRLSHGGDVRPEDVMVTAGCNLAFTLVTTALASPGDAVLAPTPWFFNHPLALATRGVTTVPLPCRAEDGFLPDPDHAAALLDRYPAIRALLLVTPNNPTGAAYPPALVARLAELCRLRRRWLVLDETYRDFLPDPAAAPGLAGQAAPHALFSAPDWRDFVVHLYSFSKAYCIPGHRVGALVAGPALRGEVIKAVDNIQICAPRPPQAALAWGVDALRIWRAANRAVIARRTEAFRRAIARRAPAWRIDAAGAYFAYLRLPEGAPPAARVAERLAAEHGLVTLPGSAFGPGQERHLRLAYAATEEEEIEAVPDRLAGVEASWS
ncbi:aminotransferase [Roseicella aquatilis]|uniref:aspartate transaminase n=1 Tax=Roseicella aquatilis TaxID=2527868 RepID=A0A4R4DR78_9PROT|nr:aminotransferase [Roseicella aquatilis]TCZ64867.1 aminotransferase [Roseicella aquatilis]